MRWIVDHWFELGLLASLMTIIGIQIALLRDRQRSAEEITGLMLEELGRRFDFVDQMLVQMEAHVNPAPRPPGNIRRVR